MLTKCLKKQKKAEDKAGSVKETDTRGMLSPLANVYPPLPSSYQYPSPVASGQYGFPGYGQYSGIPMYQMPQMSRSYGIGRGLEEGSGGLEGHAYFVSRQNIKDCQKMKLAKTK